MSEHRLRALVLAVLMVTSVVAGSGVAVAGGSGGNSTLVVDAAGNSGDYDTVQGAVDAASAGDTIQVNSGEYRESVSIDKSLTLKGEDGATIIGQGTGKGALALLSEASVPQGASDVTIENLIVKSGESGSAINAETGGSSTAPQTGIVIRDSTVVAGQDDIGLFLANVDGVDVIGTTIRSAESESASKLVFVGAERSYGSGVVGNDVHFDDITVSGAVQARAMELEGANHMVKNSEFTYDVTDSGHAGVQLFSDTTTVKSNTFTLDYSEVGRVGLTGVVSIHGADTTVQDNTITRQNSEVSGVPAIRVSGAASGSIDILSNTLIGGPIGGYAGESTVTVTDNTVEDVSDEGIWFGDSAAATMTIKSNSVTNFDTGGQDGSSAVKLTAVPTTLNDQDGLTETEVANTIVDDNSVPSVSTDGASYDGSVSIDGTLYETLADAEDAAEPGETIELEPGQYDFVRVETDEVTITGPNDAVIDGVRLDATGVTVEGVTVETRNILGENVGIYVGDSDDHTLRGVTVVSDAKGDRGVLFSSTGSDVPKDTTIEKVEISGPVTGIYAGDATGLTVTDATITDTTAGIGGIQGDVTVADSEFTDNFEAVGVGPGSVDLSEQTGLAGADTGTYTAYHTSIQQAIDRAETGSTVDVLPGTYAESLDVRKDLTLAGSGEGKTVIDTDDSMDYGLLTTADVTLRDFTLRGPSAAADYTYGIKSQFATTSDGFERTDVHIEDVTVTNSYKTEIDLNGVGSAALVDVTADGAGTRGAGVALSDTQDVLIKDVTTTGNNWGGLAVYTNPRTDVPIGTDNVTLAGDNSFENGVYFDGDLSKITNVDAPAYAEYKASDGTSLTLFFGTQDEATTYVSAQKAPDDWLITALGDESGDGEEDDETYTVAPGQSVSATVDKVPTGSTVVVDKETIDEGITLSKSVSLVAGEASSGSVSISADTTEDSTSRPTITSSVSINNYAEDVTISGFAFDVSEGGQINANGAGDGLEIRNNVFEGGSPEGGSVVAHGGESRALLETGAQSDWVVADNEFSDIDGTALRLWNLQSVTVENNTFEDLTGSAVSHIGVDETTVRNNSFETVDKAGVYVDGWSKISSLGVQDVTVENNTFNETGALDGEYDQGGVNVGATVDDLSEITVRANDFESGQFGVHVADDAQDATGSIQASLNYWNASSGPSGVAGGEGVPVTAGVTVSPSLPEPTSEYEDVREVTGGTYSVTVPADGEPRVVAFPADVEGTAGDVFGNFSGNVFAYDAATGSWDRVENASREVDALDAFVVVPAENASDVTISYTLASSATDAPSVPPEADLDAGWNLVGAPQFGAADEAFGASTADPARVLKTYRGPTGEPFAPGFESATGVVGDTDAVSPFEGYWVYATENGTLAGNVPPGTDASDLEDLLKEA